MNTDDMDPTLIDLLNDHKTVSARDPRAAARGRARFLAEASQLREAASVRKSRRHIGWKLIFRKELPMKAMISALTLIVFLFAGAATVSAAQNDLPTGPLYGVKTISEDVGLWLTTDPSVKLDRLMELAQTRTQEIAALVEQGETIPEQVTQRLNLHIETALQLAACQSDEEMQQSLLQIRSRLQTQEQAMTQLQTSASENAQPALEQARLRTQEQLKIADQGLEDPLAFRNRYRSQNAGETDTPEPTLTDAPLETDTPAAPGYGPGPNAQGTPIPNATPGAGYGPASNSTNIPDGNGSGNSQGGENGNGGSEGGGGKP